MELTPLPLTLIADLQGMIGRPLTPAEIHSVQLTDFTEEDALKALNEVSRASSPNFPLFLELLRKSHLSSVPRGKSKTEREREIERIYDTPCGRMVAFAFAAGRAAMVAVLSVAWSVEGHKTITEVHRKLPLLARGYIFSRMQEATLLNVISPFWTWSTVQEALKVWAEFPVVQKERLMNSPRWRTLVERTDAALVDVMGAPEEAGRP